MIESRYGILCFQILVLCIQVSALVEAKGLHIYMKKLKRNKLDPTLKLERVVAPVLYDRVLAANKTRDSSNIIAVPGFSRDNAVRALNYFHLERDRFLTARLIKTNDWDAWLALFYILWSRLVMGPHMDR